MKIVYVPLDERPCNLRFPTMQIPSTADATVVTPPRALLGAKKQAADVDGVFAWLEHELDGATSAVIAVETVLYGGLIPSRIHHIGAQQIEKRLLRLHRLLSKARRRSIETYLFGMVLRTPRYSSDEEEPDYYADFGAQLFLRGYLRHKQRILGLTAGERQSLSAVTAELPSPVTSDYDRRRSLNHAALRRIGHFLAEDLVTRFVLPEDDTAEYGYGPEEKEALFSEFRRVGVAERVSSYPGADEVGSTLVAAAILNRLGVTPRVCPVYMDPEAANIVPRYESQPIGLSVASQILAAGGEMVAEPRHADVLLAVNSCGNMMREAWSQDPNDDCGRRQRGFVDYMRRLAVEHDLPIAIADCANSNGGATALIHALEERSMWPSLLSYAGWNTSGNTVGTAVAAALLLWAHDDPETQARSLSYRLLDDWAYQAIVRQKMAESTDLAAGAAADEWNCAACEIAMHELTHLWRETFKRGLLPIDPGLTHVRFPWSRLFEIELFFGVPTDRPNNVSAQRVSG